MIGEAIKPSIAWTMLIAAGLIDVAWALTMKLSQGYTKPGWTAASIVALIAFVWLLGRALTALPVGSAYAVWTGIGALGTAALGIYLFHEPATTARLACIGLILTGIVGLKWVT